MDLPYSETNAGLHYDLRLELDPNMHFVGVTGSIAYHSPLPGLERARFYLHRQFYIHRLWGKRVAGYQYETTAAPGVAFLPQAGILDVYFDPPLRKNETALIQFDYLGNITEWPAESANSITPEWAELGSYLPWFPFQYDGAPSELTFTLLAHVPAGYQVSSYGPAVLQEGAWYFSWTHPTTDIVVAAGKTLDTRVFESDSNRVFLSTATLGASAAEQMGDEMLWTLERFSGWFGPTRPGDFNILESPRALGGGYARRGLAVLSGITAVDYLEQRAAFLRYLAHEAARAWWWQAPADTWEDWLNESFAEYSALLAVRERYGVEIYERFFARKRERVPETQPLWGFDRADQSTPEKLATVERMLYDKGPLLLRQLEERIGYQRFLDFCRAMLWSGVTTTAHLLDLLEEVEDRATRAWLEEMLRS